MCGVGVRAAESQRQELRKHERLLADIDAGEVRRKQLVREDPLVERTRDGVHLLAVAAQHVVQTRVSSHSANGSADAVTWTLPRCNPARSVISAAEKAVRRPGDVASAHVA